MIAPLHVHSMYSALDGFSTPEEIADRCVEIGCPCCGLTDHGLVAGHLHFAKALQKRGLKPIFGCELYHGLKATGFASKERDQAHLIALAQTDEGLRNLWRLVHCTSQENHFHNVGRVFWEDLEKYKEGLIFTSACALSLVSAGIKKGWRENTTPDLSAFDKYLNIIGDNFYIEIHTYPADHPFKDRDSDDSYDMGMINVALVELARERGIPLVYADDAHRAFPDQYWVHDAYIALQTGDTIYTDPSERSMWHPEDAMVIHSEEDVREALSYLPDDAVDECLANSVAIAEKCSAQLPKVERHLPVFVPGDCPWLDETQKQSSPEDLFVDLVRVGIEERYGEDPSDEVYERTEYETRTLLRDGIHHYFLMGWDEIQAAKDMKIPIGPGRGSSAGCIVAYALGITDVDPLHYGLIFERFWNSGRAKGFPDIDSDFSRARRPELIQYLIDRWGRDKVCAIGTVTVMKPKATVDKLGRGCGISFDEAAELKEIIGKTTKIEILGHEQIGWNPELEPGKVHYVKNDVGKEIDRWIHREPSKRAVRQKFIDLCEICCSRVQQYGIHASGVVISDVPLDAELPAYRRGGKKGVPATQFPMSDVDARMFIKLDVLGLRTLDMVAYWEELMAEHDIEVEWSGLDTEEQPTDMWDMLRQKYTAGIFQVEDGYGRQLCKDMDPQSVEDLSVLSALNRPGPIQAGIPDRYIARLNGQDPVTYPHPILEPILSPTYGLFVYQEQIIAYFNALGYSLSESDAMRKIMGKKQPQDLAAIKEGTGEWDGVGYMVMAERSGIPEDVAEEVWKEIEGFADYCFNKSHTVAYSIISFRTLYAKYWAAAEAFAANLRSLDPSSDSDKRKTMIPAYINECRRLNIDVRPPDIRYAKGHAYVDPVGRLLFGFSDVRNIANSGDYLVGLRDDQHLPIATPEAFITAFEALNDQFLKYKAQLRKEGLANGHLRSPKQQLRINQIESLEKAGAWDDMGVREITLTQRQKNEEEMLGVILTDNSVEVLDRHTEEIAGCDSWDDMLLPFDQKPEWLTTDDEYEYFQYEVCGIVTNTVEKHSKASGKPFGIITIEYNSDSLECMMWNTQWKKYKSKLKLRTVAIFTVQHLPAGEYSETHVIKKAMILT